MVKVIIGILLMVFALICIGSTVFEFIAAKGKMGIWSEDVMGAAAFHATCMIIASFLLFRPKSSEKVRSEE